ncbi:hypothetical protein ACT3UM_06755 [Halomonas sp. AOP13-D3-9]
MNKKLVFVSKREDGLGERLRAILNAFALAEVYDAQFKFCWNNEKYNRLGHGVDFVDKVFGNDFIEKHYVEPSAIKNGQLVENFLITKDDGIYFCNQKIQKNAFKDKSEFFVFQQELKKSFHSIGFSKSIELAINKAYELKIDNDFVALHLRAGDVVYGPLSQNCSTVSKSISYPVALKIIDDANKTGNKILVFGQDVDLLRALSKMPNVTLAMDLAPRNMSRTEQAFFDITLMSQCSTIYAGSSGFAIVASLISNAVHVVPGNNYSKCQIADIFDKYLINHDRLEGVSNEQIGFACKSALIVGMDIFEDEKHSALINIAKKNDPDNLLFPFLNAWHNYKKGLVDEAESEMEKVICKKSAFNNFVKNNSSTKHSSFIFRKIFDASTLNDYLDKPAAAKIYQLLNDTK